MTFDGLARTNGGSEEPRQPDDDGQDPEPDGHAREVPHEGARNAAGKQVPRDRPAVDTEHAVEPVSRERDEGGGDGGGVDPAEQRVPSYRRAERRAGTAEAARPSS